MQDGLACTRLAACVGMCSNAGMDVSHVCLSRLPSEAAAVQRAVSVDKHFQMITQHTTHCACLAPCPPNPLRSAAMAAFHETTTNLQFDNSAT